jgi:nitrogen fixation protein NifZ
MIDEKFESGDKVRVIRNIRSDVNLNGLDRGELLIRRGSIGYVKSSGTLRFDETIYQVHFVDQGITLGCRNAEVCAADEPWDERQFERGDKVRVQLSLASDGEVVVAKGDIGTVMGRESKEGPVTYRVSFDRGDSIDSNSWVIPEKVLKLDEAVPTVLGRG